MHDLIIDFDKYMKVMIMQMRLTKNNFLVFCITIFSRKSTK